MLSHLPHLINKINMKIEINYSNKLSIYQFINLSLIN